MIERLRIFCTFMDLMLQALFDPDKAAAILSRAVQVERERAVHALQLRVHNYLENERRQFRNRKILDAIKECKDKPWPTERNSE